MSWLKHLLCCWRKQKQPITWHLDAEKHAVCDRCGYVYMLRTFDEKDLA